MLSTMKRRLLLTLLLASAIEAAPTKSSFTLKANRKSSTEDWSAYWSISLDVGASTQLDMIVDTGTAGLILNPNIYKPGPNSKDSGHSFDFAYTSPNRDGSPTDPSSCHVFTDNVSIEQTSLNVTNQPIGALQNPQGSLIFPSNGVFGLSGPTMDSDGDKSWLNTACSSILPQCRFGMSFGTDGSGGMVFGSVDTNAFNGDLFTVPVSDGHTWYVKGDVSVNGQTVRSDATLSFSSGNSVIYGPEEDVRAMFEAAGMLVVSESADSTFKEIIYGEFDCNNPPQIGFTFHSTSGSTSTFNLPPATLLQTNNNGKCKSNFIGTAYLQDHWIVGQAFYEGHYVDHNVGDLTMGFATLK